MESLLLDLWAAAKTAGPFGILLSLVLLYHVNNERVVHRDARLEFLGEMIKALNESAQSSKTLAEAIEERNKVSAAIEKAMISQTNELRKLQRKLDSWLDA